MDSSFQVDSPTGRSHRIDQFFVPRGYRRKGVGSQAAHLAFTAFPGPWRVSEIAQNKAAQSFWRKVVGEYTGGYFTESWSEAEDRLIQSFVSAGL